MDEIKDRIDELAGMMQEFGLDSARSSGADWSVEFSRDVPVPGVIGAVVTDAPTRSNGPRKTKDSSAPSLPSGIPINSPTTGIFYSSPNPGAAAFVKVGDNVEAGQVIGLIEAMKVFNEITATVSGVVSRVVAENGQLVQPGDPLLYIG